MAAVTATAVLVLPCWPPRVDAPSVLDLCDDIEAVRAHDEHYVETQLASGLIDVLEFAGLPDGVSADDAAAYGANRSPWSLPSGMSLDRFWYSNRLSAGSVRAGAAPLGEIAIDELDDAVYVVAYYPGDTLVLDGSPLVRLALPNGPDTTLNLANPGQIDGLPTPDVEVVAPATGALTQVLALERDKKRAPGARGSRSRHRHLDHAFAGTVVVAPRIVVTGTVRTDGYDLILVSNDAALCGDARVITTPPARPSGPLKGFDYGYGGDGYDAGDFALIAQTVEGTLEVEAHGGAGQDGAPVHIDAMSDPDNPFAFSFHPVADANAASSLEPAEVDLSVAKAIVADGYFHYDAPEGLPGTGGDGGTAVCITQAGGCGGLTLTADGGGPGGLNLTASQPPPAHNLSSGDTWMSDVFIPLTDLNTSSFLSEHCSGATGAMLAFCALGIFQTRTTITRFCNVRWGTVGVPPAAGALVDLSYQTWLRDDCVTSAFVPRHYAMDAATMAGSARPGPRLVWVTSTLQQVPYRVAGDWDERAWTLRRNTPDPARFPHATITQASRLFLAEAIDSVAPQYARLLLGRADVLSNELGYADWIDRDAAFEADATVNPGGRNRGGEALYLYDAVLFLQGDATVGQDAPPPAGPFAAAARYSRERRHGLLAGHSFLGFPRPLYVYRTPDQIRPFVDQHEVVVEGDRARIAQDAERVAALVASLATTPPTAPEPTTDVERIDLALVEVDANLALKRAHLEQLATEMQTLTAEAEDIIGTANEASVCGCGYGTATFLCDRSTILNEIEIIMECSALKPCDFQCVVEFIGKFVEAIAQIVEGIIALYGSGGSDLEGWKGLLQGAGKLGKAIGEAAGMAGVAAEFHDHMLGIEENTAGLTLGIQKTLTEMYELQAFIEANPGAVTDAASTLAHVQSFVDLLDRLAAITLQIDQRRLWSLDTGVDLGELATRRLRLAAERELLVQEEQERLARAAEAAAAATSAGQTQIVALSEAQQHLDETMRSASATFDHYGRLVAIHEAARAYMHLDPTPEGRRHWDFVTQAGWDQARIQGDSAALLEDLALELQTRTLGHVRTIIAPAGVEWSETAAGSAITLTRRDRTPAETALAICPAPGCPLTPVAYDNERWQELRATSRMGFELFPQGDGRFQDLDPTAQHAWNLSFFQADFAAGHPNRTRVYAVTARLLFRAYALPTSLLFVVRVRHGQDAVFQTSDGVFEAFHFPDDSHEIVLDWINADSGGAVSASSTGEAFTEIIQYPPLDTPTLVGVTAGDLRSNDLFGQSLRGRWEIDLGPTVEALSLLGQAEVDRFFEELAGIEFVVYYVGL